MTIEQIRETDSVSDVLDRSKDRNMAEVIVLGWSKDGDKLVLDTNCGRNMEIHWLLTSAANAILDDCKS